MLFNAIRLYIVVTNDHQLTPRLRVSGDEGQVGVSLEDKTEMEQFKLMQQLDDEDKQTVMKIINTMLTKAKFKDFFNKNIAAL